MDRLKLLTKFPALQEKRNNLSKGGLALRKYVFIALSILLLLSFTALTYAEEPQIKLGGRIMVRGWYFNDANFLTQNIAH